LRVAGRSHPIGDVTPPAAPPAHAPQRRLASWCWLLGSAGAMAAAWTAEVGAGAATWFGVRGPRCPLGACLGELHCPGCGLVRSTAATLQGDLCAAWHHHPGGIAVAALLPVTFLVHLDILRRRNEPLLHRRLRRTGHLLFVGAVLAGWVLRYFVRN
jgi:hypothetical protein